jgi:hypothetical protein
MLYKCNLTVSVLLGDIPIVEDTSVTKQAKSLRI